VRVEENEKVRRGRVRVRENDRSSEGGESEITRERENVSRGESERTKKCQKGENEIVRDREEKESKGKERV
jgi:hypothetical protein